MVLIQLFHLFYFIREKHQKMISYIKNYSLAKGNLLFKIIFELLFILYIGFVNFSNPPGRITSFSSLQDPSFFQKHLFVEPYLNYLQ